MPPATRRTWRQRLSMLGLLMAFLAGPTVPAAVAKDGQRELDTAAPGTCSERSDAVPSALLFRPIVLVHGWNDDSSVLLSMEKQVEAKIGQGKFTFLSFDYSPERATWAGDPSIHQCLASYLVRAAKAFHEGGGDGKVIPVGHSMGGLAIRFAANDTVTDRTVPRNAPVLVASVLAGVITVGTPHQGSPWGGTAIARAVETAKAMTAGIATLLPPADSSAAACLAPIGKRSNTRCATPPYLPRGVPITEIAAQIVIHRTLFSLPLIDGPSADILLFGDGIVPGDSGEGYVGSGPTPKIGYSTQTDLRTVKCTYDTDYLGATLGEKVGAGFGPIGATVGSLLGTWGNEQLDWHSIDSLNAGDGSLAMAELSFYAWNTPCFHTNLPTDQDVIDIVAAQIRAYDTAAAAPAPVGAICHPVDNHSRWLPTTSYQTLWPTIAKGRVSCPEAERVTDSYLNHTPPPPGSSDYAVVQGWKCRGLRAGEDPSGEVTFCEKGTAAVGTWPVSSGKTTVSCPTSGEMARLWNASSPKTKITAFSEIKCWRWYAVGQPVSDQGNGIFHFSWIGKLHMIDSARYDWELQTLRATVCNAPDSPPYWRGPTVGMCGI